MDDLYQQNILDHYHHPRHGKPLAQYDVKVEGSNPSCGDDLHLYLKITGDVVTDIGFDSSGCAISTAAMSMLAEKVVGKTLQQVVAVTDSEAVSLLGVPIGEERLKCALLGLNTLRSAMK